MLGVRNSFMGVMHYKFFDPEGANFGPLAWTSINRFSVKLDATGFTTAANVWRLKLRALRASCTVEFLGGTGPATDKQLKLVLHLCCRKMLLAQGYQDYLEVAIDLLLTCTPVHEACRLKSVYFQLFGNVQHLCWKSCEFWTVLTGSE